MNNLEVIVNKILNTIFFIGFCIVILLNLQAVDTVLSESDNPALPILLLNARIAVWFVMLAFVLKTGVTIALQTLVKEVKELVEE